MVQICGELYPVLSWAWWTPARVIIQMTALSGADGDAAPLHLTFPTVVSRAGSEGLQM